MKNYMATFHSHYDAMIFCKHLKKNGISAKPAPVPRKISADCGTCIIYEAENPPTETPIKPESTYLVENGNYSLIPVI